MFRIARQIASLEGPGALLTGLGPTVGGYCLQGAFKFGGYEFFKARAVDLLGYPAAAENRNAVYLASAAAAEFLGDIALCPFESVRIRLVSQPGYADNFVGVLAKMAREEGFRGLYSGLGPILLKQCVSPAPWPNLACPSPWLANPRGLAGSRTRRRPL